MEFINSFGDNSIFETFSHLIKVIFCLLMVTFMFLSKACIFFNIGIVHFY